MDVQSFKVDVAEAVLQDLQSRLERTRWPDEVEDAGWEYGVPLGYLKEVVAYWRDSFDWRAQEARLNMVHHYRAHVRTFGIHFVHEPGKGPNPLPLLITHGWPSSFVEMLDLLPLLTDPASHGGSPMDAFDVVVPSLPGYGFSDRPARCGTPGPWHELWAALMEGLGYERYGMHAGDVGASVSSKVALAYPDRIVGYHTPEPQIMPGPYLGPGAPPLTADERAYEQVRERVRDAEGGYAHLQATRPQTLAYGLTDSPAGLAAWLLDKWYIWTAPPGGDLEASFTKDQLLTNVMVYWATRTINSAKRTYYSDGHWRNPDSDPDPTVIDQTERIRVPVGVIQVATQPVEHPPREYVERMAADIRRWVELPRGGHFIALEEPELVAENIRAFFRDLR